MVCCNYTEILEFFPNQNKTHLQLFLEQEHLCNCACIFLCYKITFFALYLLLLETFCPKLNWVYDLVLFFREKHWNYGRILEGKEIALLWGTPGWYPGKSVGSFWRQSPLQGNLQSLGDLVFELGFLRKGGDE